jgi:hypothetical protein
VEPWVAFLSLVQTMVGGLPTSSALIENNPPRSAPAQVQPGETIRHTALASHSIMGSRLPFPPCTHPFPHRLSHQVQATPSPAENLGFTLEPMTGGRAPPCETIHPSSPLPPSLIALHTVLYCSTLYTVSHPPSRCDCSRSVNPYQPPGSPFRCT